MGTIRKRSERSIDRGGRRGITRGVPLVLALIGIVSLSLSIAFARAQGLTVTQCNSSDPSCQQSTTTVTPRCGSSHPHRSSGSGSSGNGSNEVHTYSLGSGKGQVQTPGGHTRKDNLTVNVSPSVQRALHPHPHHSAPAPPTVAAPTAPPKPPVSTSGGAGLVAPFTAPLATLTGDQALAQFAVPPFLMPVYIAAGRTYGVPWNVLASINQIETNFGRNLNVSSAGAEGWMQFMPATWKSWGVDASGDGY